MPGANHYSAQGLWHHNSGKTFVGAAKVVSRLQRRELGLACAPTYPMLRDATQRTLFGMIRDLGIPFEYNKSEKHLTIPGTGHEILFRSLDDPDNLRGPNVAYAWTDEAAYISGEAWRIVKGRVRVGDLQQAWITGTPKGRNWIWDEWVKRGNYHHTMYRFRTDENPTLDPDFAASLGYEGKFAEQELGGEFVAFEGLVYDGFDRPRNVQRVDTTGWRKVLGVDVGARNPTVVLTICIAGDERVHIEREFYQRNMGSVDILAAIKGEIDRALPEQVYIDPSAAAYITDLWRAGYPATKANNDVQTGIQQVTSALPGLTVDPSCVQTIAEFEAYQYPDEGKVNNDKPVKEFDHCLIAGTMVMTSEGEVPIETVQVGDQVLTRDGYRPVIAAGMTNLSAQVLTVHLSNGSTLTGTGGHPVWIDRAGWVPLDTLRYGDILMGTEESPSWHRKPSNPSSTVVSPSGAIPMPSAGRTGITSRLMGDIGSRAWGGFMKKSGRIQTVPFRTGTRFITSISTQRTMILPIFIASLLPSTVRSTGNARVSGASLQSRLLTFAPFSRLRRSGIGRTKGVSGTVSMAGRRGNSESPSSSNASSVTRRLLTSLAEPPPDSAPTSASQPGAEPLAQMTKTEPAPSVAPRSGPIGTASSEPAPLRVVAVSRAPQRQAVYNLTVATTPEYFANGVLVHNCMDALRYGIMGALNVRRRRRPGVH